MVAFLIKIFIALIVVSCSVKTNNSDISENIENIENNLIEFTSPAAMLNPDSSQLANPKLLKERMIHFNTPGVSIAVVNNFKIEWAKGYGSIDTDKVGPVNTETIFRLLQPVNS